MRILRDIMIYVAAIAAALSMYSCQEKEADLLVENVKVSVGDRKITHRGATVDVTFKAPLSWAVRLELKNGEGQWATLREDMNQGEASQSARVRIVFEKNESSEERTLDVWVTLGEQDEQLLCTLTQAVSEESADAAISKSLNAYMHEILQKDYLFADAYNELEVDLTVSYKDFLSTHLLQLGKVNEADGGYDKETGERFIYTNVAEVQYVTKAVQTTGYGFGPFISTALAEGSTDMGIAPSFVRRGSPAAAAGLQRGDIIYGVNGQRLTTSNYGNFMYILYQGGSSTYKFDYLRYEQNGSGGYTLNAYTSDAVTPDVYVYDPVLYASILGDDDNEATKIGYLVYESFDVDSQEFLKDAIDQFVEAGITDMILDLRFNAGGAVAQSRWLSGCIAGPAHDKSTFTKVIYRDGSDENWTFGHGYTADVDNLGKPVDLGLDRLYIITSYNTASAAELVINSLKGIDFPVKLIGGTTEGKNVGMTVSQYEHDGRIFHFSPVTFWVRNAKDFGDYPNGINPDEYVRENVDNAFPYSFADWGNMDFNIALQWAYCDITGKDRWNSLLTKSAASEQNLTPCGFQKPELAHGRSGLLVYDGNNN